MAATISGMGGRIPRQEPTLQKAELPQRPQMPTIAEPLDPDEYAEWVAYLKAMMRHDLCQAEIHSDAWEQRKTLIERTVERERGAVDKVILRARCKEDIKLGDEMDAWYFFQRRALLYAGVLQAEMATRLGGFGL